MFDVVVGESNSSLVADLDWSHGLQMTKFFEGGLNCTGLFGGEESCSDFCFHYGAHDILHDLDECIYHFVSWGRSGDFDFGSFGLLLI